MINKKGFQLALLLILQVWLSFSVQGNQTEEQIVIDYEGSTRIRNLFVGDDEKFYVDLGAYDPIFLSNTLELEMAGWQGVNLQPHHVRHSRFIVLRPGQVNLNMAVSESVKFVTLFNLKKSELSTVNPNEEEKLSFVDKISVPSTSLKNLCQKYYKIRPTLINIGFQDDADKVLEGNNWQLIKCVPDIFVISNRKRTSNQTSTKYQQILVEKEYKRFETEQTDAQIYIKSALIDRYRKNYLISQDQNKGKRVVKFQQVLKEFSGLLKKKISNQISQNEVGLHFAKKNEVINVMDLLTETQRVVKSQTSRQQRSENPATIVMNFRLDENAIILSNCSFSLQKIVDQKIEFLNLTILSSAASKQRTSFYFFDYREKSGVTIPKIVVLNQVCLQTGNKFVASGSYQESANKSLSLGDYILEIVFTVTFLVMFLSFTTLLLFYLHSSLKNEVKMAAKTDNMRVSQQSELSEIN